MKQRPCNANSANHRRVKIPPKFVESKILTINNRYIPILLILYPNTISVVYVIAIKYWKSEQKHCYNESLGGGSVVNALGSWSVDGSHPSTAKLSVLGPWAWLLAPSAPVVQFPGLACTPPSNNHPPLTPPSNNHLTVVKCKVLKRTRILHSDVLVNKASNVYCKNLTTFSQGGIGCWLLYHYYIVRVTECCSEDLVCCVLSARQREERTMLEDTKAALQDLDKVTVFFRQLENECLVASEHLLLPNTKLLIPSHRHLFLCTVLWIAYSATMEHVENLLLSSICL